MAKKSKDILFVGGGINALVAASLLARQGWQVTLLERESQLGGCVRTDELTLPGFLHDTLSTAHPLFLVGPAYTALQQDLHAAGLEYCNTDSPTAVLTPDGRSLILSTSREENIRRFDACVPGAGQAYAQAMAQVQDQAELIFTLLGDELWRLKTACKLARLAWRQGVSQIFSFVGDALQPARAWLAHSMGAQANPVSALLAPWVLHTGLGPDAPVSALMNKVVAFTLEAVGMPLVRGGNAQTVRAFEKVIAQHGGQWRCGVHVEHVMVERGRVIGVRLLGGETLLASHVACSVTPQQLYGQLLDSAAVPETVRAQAQAYRYGKGNMQIHLALSEAPQWRNPELAQVGYVHLCSGVDAISKAVGEAERGCLPSVPTVCVAQPTALDPSRAPRGQHILWIQVPECPREVHADAQDIIALDGSGQWSERVREQFADRVMALLEPHIVNLRQATLARCVLSPTDLQKLNINLVGGDPYGGDCAMDQSMLWRPLRATRNHQTPVQNLWHIGASTHPGPGLSGTSGFHLAHALGAV